MKLIIEDDEGRKTVVPVVREEITIGRQDGNTIRLTERNVSRRHARFFRENGSLMLEDLGSYNGVRVNGDRIGEATKVKEGDLIEIGDYDLGIQGKLDPMPAGSATASKSPKTSGETAKVAKKETLPPTPLAPPPAAAAPKPAPEPVAAAPAPAPEPMPPPPAPAPQAAGATAIIRLSDLAKSAGPVEIRDLAKSEMPRLVGLNGPFRAREFYLQKTEVKIGRTDDNDLGIDHQSISRQHCKFTLEDGVWKVYDNKSANGVRLNGEDYAVTAIKPGDTVELGHVKFRFCAPGERYTPPAEPAAKVDAAAAAAAPAPRASPAFAEPSASSPSARKSAKAGASKLPLIGGVVGAVVVLGLVAFFAMGRGGGSKDSGDGSSLSAEQAVKQGDAAYAQHEYIEAVRLYDVAAGKGTQPKNLKKAKDEASAQQSYNELQKSISGGDYDKARQQLEALNSEPDRHWAKEGQAKADAVKAGYVKQHLSKASAAGSGDPTTCGNESALALQADPSNEEAQKVSQSCHGAAVKQANTVPDRPRPEKQAAPQGPSQGERDAQASKLVGEGNGLYAARDFDGAIEKFTQALALKPKGAVLGLAYRGLGTAYTQKADKGNIVKYFKAYLPFAAAAEKPKVEQIIAYYSK